MNFKQFEDEDNYYDDDFDSNFKGGSNDYLKSNSSKPRPSAILPKDATLNFQTSNKNTLQLDLNGGVK